MEYHGTLQSVDAYMNVQLVQTQEFIHGQCAGQLGEVLIRCNNVLYIAPATTAAVSAVSAAAQPSLEPEAMQTAA